ncbi:MAG: glucose-6-phosphate dehydrogenase [Micrococcaceae bacterium]
MKTKLLIFGITGDLSTRKLLPALKAITDTGDFDDLSIIGISRREVDVKKLLENSLGDTSLEDRISIVTMNLDNADDYTHLKAQIKLQDDEQLVTYLSVPPNASTQIVDFMGEAGLNTPNVKILFEKPFGVDLKSAKDVIKRTARYYDENQLYRIDHYLAKEMTQNIAAFRGGNAIFSHLWSNNFIESINIVASETIGIEGRTQFYEQTGALRDLVQGHLMQLLSLTLMDIPNDFEWQELPELRLAALKQLEPVDPAKTIRAQYEGYKDEVDNPDTQTETFVSIELQSNDSNWLGVPIHLITGKGLDKKATEVQIHLKKTRDAQSNCITFKIQPNEGIRIELFTKKPGYAHEFETRVLGFNYAEGEKIPDAYEQVIVDAIHSRKSLFTSSPEVLRSWELLADLQRTWDTDKTPIAIYDKGSDIDSIS